MNQSPATASTSIRLIQGLEGCHEHRAAFSALCAESSDPIPTMTPEFLAAWCRAFASNGEPHILAVEQRGQLTAALPLVRTQVREGGFRWDTLSAPNNGHYFMYAPLMRRGHEADILSLLECLTERMGPWDFLSLRPISSGAQVLSVLRDAASRGGWPLVSHVERESAVLRITGTWEEYLRSRRRSFLDATRRKVKKAAAAGAVPELLDGSDDPDRIAERAFAVARSSWKETEGTSIASTPRLQEFYRELIRWAAAAGTLRAAFLSIDGRDIAFEINLDYAGARYNFKMYVDENARSLSPGVVLRYYVLKDSFECGLSAFHFLGNREPHKDHWATEWDEYLGLRMFNRRALPMAHYMLSGPVKSAVQRSVPSWVIEGARALKHPRRRREQPADTETNERQEHAQP